MKNNEIQKKYPDFVIYETDDNVAKVSVRLAEDTVWLTQKQLAEIFDTTRENVVQHIKNILIEGELSENRTCKKFLQVQTEGSRQVRREIDHYNLDMIISLGYRINSRVATKFRQWATERLKEYIVKGFTLDDERLKNGGGRYFRELLQRIRDIRSSERNLWQQVTDIYATSVDYDPRGDITINFFATVQNKMHYAELELQKLNLLTEGFLGYAELQALEQKPMTMNDWKNFLDRQLKMLNKDILNDKGKISHQQAVEKAEQEFEIYRQREMRLLESDFDRAVKELTAQANKNNNDRNE